MTSWLVFAICWWVGTSFTWAFLVGKAGFDIKWDDFPEVLFALTICIVLCFCIWPLAAIAMAIRAAASR